MTDYKLKQLINGAWVDANTGGTWPLVNPATEETIQEGKAELKEKKEEVGEPVPYFIFI